MIRGIDISHNNDAINWAKLPPDLKFVYIKATQGGSFQDNMFQANWKSSRDAGLFHGGYHFLTVTDTAEKQAANFLSRGINFSLPGVLPPMLDIEDQVGKDAADTARLNKLILNNKPAFIQLATDWINIVAKATGRTPVIYSYKNFFAEYLNNHSWPNPLWLASYQPKQPGLPVGWSKYTFWQYSQYGKVDGSITGGGFDLDWFNGTIDDLKAL